MLDLTTGKEGRQIIRFAMPMLLGNVFQQLYNVVDSIIVGNYLGKQALAAVGASFPIVFVLISLIIGIAQGFTIIISQYFGAKDMSSVRKTIDTMYIFLFFASILITALGLVFSESIFKLTNLPEDVMPEAILYINIYISGIILFFGYNGTAAVLRGLGDSKTPLYFLIIATISNIFLDLLFIVVFKMGIEGAGLATIISHGGAFIALVFYLNKTHKIINLSFRKLHYDRLLFKKSMKIGLPSGFQQTFVAIGMIALYGIVNAYGTDVVAAFAVAGRIDFFAMMPAMNFSQALSTFVGQNIGANKIERVRKGLLTTWLSTSAITLVISIVVLSLSNELMSVFTKDPAVISIGADYLIIASSFYLVFTSMFVINGVMRGAGETLVPMMITLFALWFVRLPASWLLSGEYGVIGIWWGIPAGWIVGALASFLYYLSGRWKTKGVVRHRV